MKFKKRVMATAVSLAMAGTASAQVSSISTPPQGSVSLVWV